MKQTGVVSLALGFVFSVFLAVSWAQDHQIPVAPQEYLDMENPIDEDDVDDDFLKKVGRLYKSKCTKCHGAEGDGQGSAAEDITDPKPTALNVPGYMDGRKDGQLFWIVAYGSEGTEMNGFGPESDAGLSEEKVWQLVTYMRAKFTN